MSGFPSSLIYSVKILRSTALCQKVAKRVSESCQKVARKLTESCKKVAKKSCQKIVKKIPESCQKVTWKFPKNYEKVIRKAWESCEKVKWKSTMTLPFRQKGMVKLVRNPVSILNRVFKAPFSSKTKKALTCKSSIINNGLTVCGWTPA